MRHLQSRLAATLSRPKLDDLYLANLISPEEYQELLIGSGWTAAEAIEALQTVHDNHAPPHWERPTREEETPDWSEVGKPGRKPNRFKSDHHTIEGHPIDDEG